MRRQTMQYFFIFLIVVLSINLNFSSLANHKVPPPQSPSGSEPRGGKNNQGGSKDCRSGPPRNRPLTPPDSCYPESPPPPVTPVHPPPPPSAATSMPPPLPPPSTEPPPKERAFPSGNQKVGKFVGLVFLGIAGVLQVGVVSYLVFKKRQINRKYCKLELSPTWSSRDGR